MLLYLDNLQRFFIFSNYIGEKDYFMLDFLKGLILNAGYSKIFLIVNNLKGEHGEGEFKR